MLLPSVSPVTLGMSHPRDTWFSQSSHSCFFLKSWRTFKCFFSSNLHYWTHSAALSFTRLCCAPENLHMFHGGDNCGPLLMQKKWVHCNECTQQDQLECNFAEEREKTSKIRPYRLLHIAVAWICAQLQVKCKTICEIFIFICQANSLIGILSRILVLDFSEWGQKNKTLECILTHWQRHRKCSEPTFWWNSTE